MVTAEVRLHELNTLPADCQVVDLVTLKMLGLVRRDKERVRVMLKGTIERPLTLKGIGVTAGARAAIEAAGGTVEA
jgi:large subunit ribosomal protein L15